MVALDLALILVGWNGRADGETRRYVYASRQSDEVRVEITTIAGASIARIDGVSAAPTITCFIIPHAADDVIVQRFRPLEVIGFSGYGFLGECLKRFVYRHQFFRPKIPRGICLACRIGDFFLAHDLISQLDRFAPVLRLRIDHANVIAVIAVLNLVPFHRDIQLFHSYGLESVCLRERYPDASGASDFRKFDAINELKFIGAFDDAGLTDGMNGKRGGEEKRRSNNQTHGRLRHSIPSSRALYSTCRFLLSNCKEVCRRSCARLCQ